MTPSLPPAVRTLLTDAGIPPETLRTAAFAGPRRPVQRLLGDGVVVEVASTETGRLRLRRELWGREWARQVGVPTVPVLDADPGGGWMVAEWWRPHPPTGTEFLDAAVTTALRIAGSPPPQPGPPPARWTSPRWAAPIRLARGALGGVPTRLWLAARRAAAALPSVPVAHGDFYHRNALWCPEQGGVHVVDWEYLGHGPKHGDLLRLWTLLPHRTDRDALLDRLLALTPPGEHRAVGTLALYLALRLLGENVKGQRADRHRADLDHARTIQPEARAVARSLDAWPV
ncbi:phosphotransferase [Cryptosporangium aurantiacum]|uniref:Phosphotransferase enzyme family protein n=1 Tax=Cryptosporangium aurantiacum TaxID=134849 RepID=A0A1M7RJ88_9ACTN|nr:phosphotransferase [Cryptosporangium aurantiacum]SHN46363.1 Phosphotransferase enzyme family protein [Cryptosporangium aurantiacum]